MASRPKIKLLEMEEEIQPFWTLLIKPGETSKVQYPEDCFLTITNVCITELPSDVKNSPVRLIAKVHNYNEQGNSDEKENKDVLLASLLPYTSEQAQVNYVFTPISDVSLTVSGCAPIQVSGIIQPIYDDEEEEEEEDLNENQGKEKENQEEGK